MSSNFWTSTHCNHWILPSHETLAQSRSLDLRYLSPHHLSLLHIFFSTLISKLGKKLSLRHLPIHTATVYFKRFYLQNGFCESDPWVVAATAVYVAAKVEETPLHIKTVASEARNVFAEYAPKSSLPTLDPPTLAEMEFYLLEELHFDLVVFHPYRSLLAICNREPADGGEGVGNAGAGAGAALGSGARIGVESRKRKRWVGDEGRREEFDEDGGLDGMGKFGGAATGENVPEEEESPADKVDRLNGRGSGLDALEVEDSVVQMAWFILNDTYRTDLILLHPPHLIALAALYLAFSLSDTKPDASTYRVRGKKWVPVEWHGTSHPSEYTAVRHGGRGLLTRFDAPEWFAGLRVGFELVLEAVQEIVSVYTLWEGLEPGGGAGAGGQQQQQQQQQQQGQQDKATLHRGLVPGPPSSDSLRSTFLSQQRQGMIVPGTTSSSSEVVAEADDRKLAEGEVVGLLRRIQLERSVDVGHPRDAGLASIQRAVM